MGKKNQTSETSNEKPDWTELAHADRVKVLAAQSNNQIVGDYALPNATEDEFRALLEQQRTLWDVENVSIENFAKRGEPPTKDVVLGSFRDLDRSEAILELIDNSIDAWNSRRAKFPNKTAKELDVQIRLDTALGQLTYEDTAGGVSDNALDNLVVPGYSGTKPESATIGSYKTGGKKAIFRLATAARVTTHYWSTSGSPNTIFSIQLDEKWMTDVSEYKYDVTTVANKASIDPGKTKYVLQLRKEPIGSPWYQNPDSHKAIQKDIQRRYGLLLIRNPEINIYFQNLKDKILPNEDSFKFSGTSDSKKLDIRPQRVNFSFSLTHEGIDYPLVVEIVLGCRTTTGFADGENWGIDWYGNDRLFVEYDQETFAEFFPGGQVRNAVRGFVNIKGPNIFVPWDTHKRHLNKDTEIVRILTKHKAVRELFSEWKKTYNEISKAKEGGVIKLLADDSLPPVKKNARDLNIPHTDDVTIKTGTPTALAPSVHRPLLPVTQRKPTNQVKLQLVFTKDQANGIASSWGIPVSGLKAKITSEMLKRATGKKK
jgi:hypothetical protein